MTDSQTPTPAEPSKQDIIVQISKALVERRRMKDLTLLKVSQTLKIRLPYLEAIERGEWDQLPGEVYVRGFIKRYAHYLGLDADKLLAPYLALDNAAKGQPAEMMSSLKGRGFSTSNSVWFVLGIVFLLVLFRMIRSHTPPPVAPQPATVPKEVEVSTPTAKPVVEEEKPAPSNAHQLQIYSPYQLWLRVEASGKTFEGFIPEGSTWNWKGEGQFSIRLGHSKDVVMYFDGQAVPLREDQKRLRLPNEN